MNSGDRVGSGQSGHELALVALEVDAERGQGSRHGVQIRGDRWAGIGDLRRLVPHGSVHRAGVVVNAPDTAEVDQLERFLTLDDVVGFEVAVQEAQPVQVPEGGQDLQHVGDRLLEGQRVHLAARRGAALLQKVLQRGPAHVLHHDVAGALVLYEVEDLDDVGMLDLGQESPLGHRGLHGVSVTGVEKALEDDPAVGHVAVAGQIDPAEPAVGQAADDFVLSRSQVPLPQFRAERKGVPAVAAESFRPAPGRTPAPTDGLPAMRAEPLVLGHLGIGHDGVGRVPVGDRRNLHQTLAEMAASRATRPARTATRRGGATRHRRLPGRPGHPGGRGRGPHWRSRGGAATRAGGAADRAGVVATGARPQTLQ